MSPVPLSMFRELSRQAPRRARHVWSEGLGVSFDEATCGSAVAAIAEADLSGYRFSVIADIGRETAGLRLPTPLLSAVRMEPGWLGHNAFGDEHPLGRIGAAMALMALGAAQVGGSTGRGEIRHDPAGGVIVIRP